MAGLPPKKKYKIQRTPGDLTQPANRPEIFTIDGRWHSNRWQYGQEENLNMKKREMRRGQKIYRRIIPAPAKTAVIM